MTENQINEEVLPQTYDSTADKQDDEDIEVIDQDTEDTEETTTEQDPAIAEYVSKSEALDERLAEYQSASIVDKKVEAMKRLRYNDSQIERYSSFIDGDTDEEIDESVKRLFMEIPPVVEYGDPNPMNGAKSRPNMKDPIEIGRNAIKRVIDKIRL